jgi:hypothetical protein
MEIRYWVGGNLPESLLPELIETLQDDEVSMIEGTSVPEGDSIENLLKSYHMKNSIEIEFNIDYDMDGELHDKTTLDKFCTEHGLTFKKLMPPVVSDGHYNECIYYWTPGMGSVVCIPTDGEGNYVLDQTSTLVLFDECWALSQRPVSDMPLLVNDKKDVPRLYATACLAGKSFDQIFKELLLSQVGHEETVCLPFKIIKGR